MTVGLPFLTAADPPLVNEGSLDPLRLAPLAEALAEEVLPGITNRMSRIRFVTATAVASAVTEGLEDFPPKDGVTTPYLAFEWHVVEAVARKWSSLPPAAREIPGNQKARNVVSRGEHLSAGTYLKTPKVFGFVGVYKRLAANASIVDSQLALGPNAAPLLRVWEKERGLDGLVDGRPGSPGAKFGRDLRSAVVDALRQGAVARTPGSWIWSRIVDSLRPDGAGPRERHVLKRLLLDVERPVRREAVELIATLPPSGERESVRAMGPSASRDLRRRLKAIEAYERVAKLLVTSFDVARHLSTGGGLKPTTVDEIAGHPLVDRSSTALPAAFERAMRCLSQLGVPALTFESNLGAFEERHEPSNFVRVLMEHHARVQAEKSARSWFEEDAEGYFVRSPYVLHEEPVLDDSFVHPYRIGAIRSFIGDLR